MAQCFLLSRSGESLVNVSHIESFKVVKEDDYIPDKKATYQIIAVTKINVYVIKSFLSKDEAKSYLLNWKENMVSTWGYMMEVT